MSIVLFRIGCCLVALCVALRMMLRGYIERKMEEASRGGVVVVELTWRTIGEA